MPGAILLPIGKKLSAVLILKTAMKAHEPWPSGLERLKVCIRLPPLETWRMQTRFARTIPTLALPFGPPINSKLIPSKKI